MKDEALLKRSSRAGVHKGSLFACLGLLAVVLLTATPPVSAAAGPACPNNPIREAQAPMGALDLPDCRAWEQISNADKNGGNVVEPLASPDGQRAYYTILGGSIPGSSAVGSTPTALAERGIDSWITNDLVPPAPFSGKGLESAFRLRSEDLTQGVLQWPSALTPDADPNVPNLYRQDGNGNYQLLTPNGIIRQTTPAAVDGSFQHIAYTAFDPQTSMPNPVAVSDTLQAYEWFDGEVRLVGILPDATCGAPPCVAPAGAIVGSSDHDGSVDHAVSGDGQRIFFTAIVNQPGCSCPPAEASSVKEGQLYVREEGNATKHLSFSQKTNGAGPGGTDPDGPLDARYWDAEAATGSKVLFSSCEELTNDAVTRHVIGVDPVTEVPIKLCYRGQATGEPTTKDDLYRYDLATEELVDLTAGDPEGGRLGGVLGASKDLEHIYFVAFGVLGDGAAGGAISGEPNVYLWDHGTVHFIASWGDTPTGSTVSTGEDAEGWSQQPSVARHARVTPDGGHLLFESRAPVTGFDNSGPACEFELCREVYLYAADTDTLTCISCGGLVPNSDARMGARGGVRTLSDDGGRAMFESFERLTSGDDDNNEDVYLFDDGQVQLISSGVGTARAQVGSISASGDDAYFLTRDQLIASDRDDEVDLYDARVGGGFLPPPVLPACEGDACLVPPVIPNDPTPASASFSGVGNVESRRPPCRRGKVRRKGRCVPKKEHAPRTHRTNSDRRASR